MAGGGRWRLSAIATVVALTSIAAACSSTTAAPEVEDMAVGADIASGVLWESIRGS